MQTDFVYNVFIAVQKHLRVRKRKSNFPKGELNYHVHSQRDS